MSEESLQKSFRRNRKWERWHRRCGTTSVRATRMFYPVYLNLRGKRVVVIGGGEVAERKIESLLGTGASIIAISPEITARLLVLATGRQIELHRRRYLTGDCRDAAFVF